MARRFVEVLKVDAQQCWRETVKHMEILDYNVVDARVEPSEIKVPNG